MALPGVTIVTGPTVEPVTLAEAKLWLRVDADDDNDLISELIAAARERVERETNRALNTQTIRLSIDEFPLELDPIRLPRNPVQSVSSVTYTDWISGLEVAVDASNYQLDTSTEPARLAAAYGTYWPYSRGMTFGSVKVTYVAGYGDAPADVPRMLRLAIKMLCTTWYENREAFVTGTIATELPHTVSAILKLYSTGEYV